MFIVKKKKLSDQIKNIFPLGLILLAGIIVRICFYYSLDGAITVSDTPTYVGGAMNLYSNLWLSEYRPPVYPIGIIIAALLFSWHNLNTGVILLQILLSLVNVIFVYKLVYEAFNSKVLALTTSFILAISFRIYCWDFIILTENFAILLVTLITYTMVRYFKCKEKKYLTRMFALMLTAIFTKPFFLMLPFAVLFIFLLRYFIVKDIELKTISRAFITGIASIYICIFCYSAVNYAQNLYFGLTTVGNVNYFGKILQYNMFDTGSNQELINDIEYAFKTEKPEFKVNNEYLEPWHFVGTYGWTKNHYNAVGKFATEIILRHPVKYTIESLKLTYKLMALNSPFKDYIADAALSDAGHPNVLMMTVRKPTDYFDGLYKLVVLCFLEAVYLLISKRKTKNIKDWFFIPGISILIIYHYVVSAFFSYGDYCRLLAPSYSLIYIVIAMYIYRFSTVALQVISAVRLLIKSKAVP